MVSQIEELMLDYILSFKLSVSPSNHTKYDTKHNVSYETKIYLILVLINRVHVRSWANDCAKHDWELQ